MRGGEGDCCVVVVGDGAAGALPASHLVTSLSPRYRVALVDPAPTTGRGAAYSTTDKPHLLNVPASGMSAFPRDPEHFFRWVRNRHDPEAQPQDFVPRAVYGDYVHSLLQTAAEYPGNARLERREEDGVEVSFLDSVTVRLRSDEATGAAALLRHVRLFPRDALAVSVAVPTVAFGGLTSGHQTAALVEGLGKTYGDDWWYAGQLAFVRQDQDTLVYALARSGQGEQAAEVLDERLSRRA